MGSIPFLIQLLSEEPMKAKLHSLNFLKHFLMAMVFVVTMLSFKLSAAAEMAEGFTYLDYNLSTIDRWQVSIEGDDIWINNYDTKRATSIGYRTYGFSISRCTLGMKQLHNGAASQCIVLPIFSETWEDVERVFTQDGHTYVHSRWHISLSEIIAEVRRCGFNEWANEIEAYYITHTSTETCYLKFDSILVTFRETNSVTHETVEEGFYDFMTRTPYFKCFPNTPDCLTWAANKQNPYAVQHVYSWRDNTGLPYRYNRYLPMDGESEGPEGPDPIIYPESASFLYETKNYSTVFDISKAIPSGEDVTNKVSASSTYGNVTVTSGSESKGYSVKYHYYYRTKHYEYNYHETTQEGEPGHWTRDPEKRYGHDVWYYYSDNSGAYKGSWGKTSEQYEEYLREYGWNWKNGDLVTVHHGDYSRRADGTYYYVGSGKGDYTHDWDGTYDNITIEDKTYNFTATAYYQYISSFDMNGIDSLTVYNGAFPGGKIDYPGDGGLTNRDVSASLRLYSNAAASAGREYDALNGSNTAPGRALGAGDFSPSGQHVRFSAVITDQDVEMPEGSYSYMMAQQKINDEAALKAAIGAGISARNDYFAISDNGVTTVFMRDGWVSGGTVRVGSGYDSSYGTKASESDQRYGAGGTTYANYVNNLLAKRSAGACTVTIPVETQNLAFPTAMTARYKKIFGGELVEYKAGKTVDLSYDTIYNHVMTGGVLSQHNGGDPDDGYPIRVHTPVVSPIRIVFNTKDDAGRFNDAIEKTQLVPEKYNTSAEYQLLLDRQYYLEFDTYNWASNVYGSLESEGYANVFDRYVQKKYVRFPFGVVYEGVYYPLKATGYTDYIRIKEPADPQIPWTDELTDDDIAQYKSNNHWQMMPFYVPSFSDECGWTGQTKTVEVLVYAKNWTGADLASEETSIDVIDYNGDTNQYIAQAKRQVQLSGWMYDFSIVGTTNRTMYTGENLDTTSIYDKNTILSFADLKSELKVGTRNRLGTDNLRTLKEGDLFAKPFNPLQTIPMRTGQSFAFGNLGMVWKGQHFSYTLKTMANLNGLNDSIHIVPHFKYVTTSGEVLHSLDGEMKMYMVSDDGKKMTIEEFNPGDMLLRDANTIYLGSELFKESYYNEKDTNAGQMGDWVTRTAARESELLAAAGMSSAVTNSEILTRKITSYNLHHIKIPAKLRWMAGEYEQLQMNDGKAFDRITGTNGLTTYWDTITNYSAFTEAKFKNSIQQWSSGYVVPENTYIVDTRTIGGSLFDIKNYIANHPNFSWGGSPIVDNGEGTLIIGFDIVAYKDGEPYLTYGGGNNNMWKTENPDEDPDDEDDEDDVVKIDFKKKVSDYTKPGISNIN